MRRILVAVSVFVLMGSVSYAQVTPDVHAGSKALLFTFDGLNTLRANDFEGGAGVKWYLDNMTAIRGGLQFTKAHNDLVTNPPAGQTGTDGSQDASTIGVVVAIERHLSTMRVSPYFGAGGGFSTTGTENTNPVVGNPPGPQTTTKNAAAGQPVGTFGTFAAGTTIQGFGLFGFEFFLTKEISFAAEYRLGLLRTSRKDQEVTLSGTTTTTKVGSQNAIGIASTATFTMAVYF